MIKLKVEPNNDHKILNTKEKEPFKFLLFKASRNMMHKSLTIASICQVQASI